MTRFSIVTTDDIDDRERTIIVTEDDGDTWQPVALTDRRWADRIVHALNEREKWM